MTPCISLFSNFLKLLSGCKNRAFSTPFSTGCDVRNWGRETAYCCWNMWLYFKVRIKQVKTGTVWFKDKQPVLSFFSRKNINKTTITEHNMQSLSSVFWGQLFNRSHRKSFRGTQMPSLNSHCDSPLAGVRLQLPETMLGASVSVAYCFYCVFTGNFNNHYF